MHITHVEARTIVTLALRQRYGREPSRPVRQLAQAVGWLETGYARHWKPPGDASNNWGAIQAHAGWPIEQTFQYTDTKPNDDGTSTAYVQAFRRYGTPLEGALDLVKVVYSGGRPLPPNTRYRQELVLPAAERGDLFAFSAGLYDTVYYEGFGRTRAERIGHHALAVRNACAAACRETREPMPDGTDVPPVIRVLREGARGPAISVVQRIVGAPVDESYGPVTALAVKRWQKAHRLKDDGVWGPVCYQVVEREITGEDLDALDGYAA
ncbi:MAG TPA: peptidoglycan-binding protein [Polyangiaceae bacterium]|nr:peptidoglycan-binding protein [Polyangiaceae bacterium]